MPTSGLTVITRVTPGLENRLREILNRIGNDINGKRLNSSAEPHIDFPKSGLLHFARFVMLDDRDSGQDRKRLLFASDFDGDWREHVSEVLRLTNDPDAIWGCCEDYMGREEFSEFIRTHNLEAQAYYIAFRDETVRRIRRSVRLHSQLGQLLSGPDGLAVTETAEFLPCPSVWARQVVGLLEKGVAVVGRFFSVARTISAILVDALLTMVHFGPLNAILAARKIMASLGRLPFVNLFNRLTFNSLPSASSPYSAVPIDTCGGCTPAVAGDEVVSLHNHSGTPPPIEDLISQNQLTLVTVVKPERLRRLHAVLAAISIYAGRLAPPGALVGISTIHTVRWLVIDGGKRLLMVSNYDGSWENYIDEFAEMILSGLDAIWENTYGYPGAGAQDVAALKRFLRCHQVPSNVFFSAYPDTTVLNIIDDKKLASGMANQIQQVEEESLFTAI